MEKYYRHFKGNLYRLVGIAKYGDTLEELVVYQAMYGDHQLRALPKDMFFGKVECDGKVMDRFQEMDDEAFFPDIEFTNEKLPLTLGEFSKPVQGMITLLQNRRIVPAGFFQGLQSDDDLENEAIRRIKDYQDGDDLECIFHMIQTWGGTSGRGIYVYGNGFDWSTIKPAYERLVLSCLNTQSLTENSIGYLAFAVRRFEESVRYMGVAYITKHTRFWLHKRLGDNALPIYDSYMARYVMRKESANSKDLNRYWNLMVNEAGKHQVKLVPFERQLFRYYYNLRMKIKGFQFKYYRGEPQNPFSDKNDAMWWSGEKLFYDTISRETGDQFIHDLTKDFDKALSHHSLKGKLLDKTISKKDRMLIYYLDLWHGKWFPYDNLDEIYSY